MYSFLLLGAAATAAAPVTVPPQAQLIEQVRQADAELFKMFFEEPCDIPRFRGMIADSLEFHHDKGGFNARKPDDFVAQYKERCTNLLDRAAYRSRRVLVQSSLRVDPIPGWGAMEVGDHLFYERHGVAGEEKLVGKAKFAMVWVLGADGKWRISRILSFAHEAAQ